MSSSCPLSARKSVRAAAFLATTSLIRPLGLPPQFATLEFLAQRNNDAVHCLYVLDREPFRKSVNPRGLQAHGHIERLFSLLSENNKLRSPVMRVVSKCHEPLLVQVVDDPLHVLTIGAHTASEPRNRLRAFRRDHCAKDLPARASEPKPRNQPIASGQ